MFKEAPKSRNLEIIKFKGNTRQSELHDCFLGVPRLAWGGGASSEVPKPGKYEHFYSRALATKEITRDYKQNQSSSNSLQNKTNSELHVCFLGAPSLAWWGPRLASGRGPPTETKARLAFL